MQLGWYFFWNIISDCQLSKAAHSRISYQQFPFWPYLNINVLNKWNLVCSITFFTCISYFPCLWYIFISISMFHKQEESKIFECFQLSCSVSYSILYSCNNFLYSICRSYQFNIWWDMENTDSWGIKNLKLVRRLISQTLCMHRLPRRALSFKNWILIPETHIAFWAQFPVLARIFLFGKFALTMSLRNCRGFALWSNKRWFY